MKTISIASLAALMLMITACGNKDKETEASPLEETSSTIPVSQQQFESNGFKLGSLEQREFPEVVESSGVLDVPPENRATVSTILGGFVKKAPLLIGDRVKKGQVLLVLESQEVLQLQQRYLEVHNQLEYLESEYRRNSTLYQENITSEKNYLQAKSNYETQRATHQGLAQQLRMLNISPQAVQQGSLVSQISIPSPIQGSVSKVNVTQGSYVSPATEIMEIVNNEDLHLELTVFEKDILKLREGQPIRFKIPGASTAEYWGEVLLVGVSIDDANRSITVHGHLMGKEAGLLPGMFVEATILTESKKGWSLPEAAVVSPEGVTQVLRLRSKENGDYLFEPVVVQKGKSYGGHTEILPDSKLGEGDQFLVKGSFDLIGG